MGLYSLGKKFKSLWSSVVNLSLNFGHHKPMMTGIAYAQGDKIFLIDTDLEESSEWLEEFHERFVSDNAVMVYDLWCSDQPSWYMDRKAHGLDVLLTL